MLKFSFKKNAADKTAKPEPIKKLKAEKLPRVKKEKSEKPPREKKVKGDAAIKGKKASFSRQARFTLLIGDEGAILIRMKGSRVLSRQFVADASESNLAELRATIIEDELAPITMIIDSMDQMYVQQTLPPVSSLSVQKLIKRRMDRDFKPDDIKGAIVLGKEKTGRKDWNFLMISVDKSPQMTLWLDFVMSLKNRFRGIVLLSVEAEIFVKNLERAMGGMKLQAPSEWKFIVSHNKVGGFRQIVLRNGRLIFTRLAQPVGEPTPEVIAGNVEQEMLTTIEYLKRFGYDSRKGVDITIIAAEPVVNLIDGNRFDAAKINLLTPFKVAEYLGIEGATQPSDKFGDVIIAAAIGGSQRSVLKMSTVESRKFDSIQKLKYGQRTFGTFLILGLIVYGAYLTYSILISNSAIEDAQQKKSINEKNLAATKKKIADSKLDLDVLMDKAEIYKLIKEQKRSPLSTLTLIASAIKPPIVINEVQWELNPKAVNGAGQSSSPSIAPKQGLSGGGDASPSAQNKLNPAIILSKDENVLVEINVDFPVGIRNAAMYKKYTEELLKAMQADLPGYNITLSDPPTEYRDNDSLKMSFGQESENQKSVLGDKPIPTKITIYGPMVSSITEVEDQ